MAKKDENPRLQFGIAGMDEILNGGLLAGGSYLLRGGPGCGKTTLGLHFLTRGAARGEKVLFISMSEPETSIRKNAALCGFELKGVSFLDLSPSSQFFSEVESYDLFSPAEVEREPTTQKIVSAVEKLKPARVFIDSLTQFRYLATDTYQFRRQTLSFLRYITEQGGTILFTSESGSDAPDDDLQFLADGIIQVRMHAEGRDISVTKFRGSDFWPGFHALELGDSGAQVFPKLRPALHERPYIAEQISSGIPDLDELLHGGLERGTVSFVTGPSGVGKTTLGLTFMKEAAGRGERSVLYTFEESRENLLHRGEAINIPVGDMLEKGALSVVQVEPLKYSPDQFARMVRDEVEEKNARIIMLDSISGYRLSLRGADLVHQVHSLVKYMANMGVTVLLVNEVEAITGDFKATEAGISYLADNIIFLRYLEINGEMRKAIGVLKKRLSNFEKTLREYEITRYGIKVGQPLTNLRNILSGAPEWIKSEPQA